MASKKRLAAKFTLFALILSLAVLVLGIVPAGARTTVTFWHSWTGDEAKALEGLIAEFNKTHEDIQVQGISQGGWSNHHQKLLTAVSGGTAPDVANLGSDYLPEWAHNGALTPLDSYISKSKYDLSDFYPISLQMGRFGGKTYGLALNQDTYALLWNKDLFKKAGLDPEKAPKTIEELDAMVEKLTVRDKDGKIAQIGFLPDFPWGHFDLYGPAFGGSFYDARNKKITANDAEIVRALEWEQGFYKKYDVKSISTFKSGFGAYATGNYAFYTGKVAMVVEGEWQAAFIPKFAPKLNWGAAPFPSPKDKPGAYGATTTVGSLLVIPKGSKHASEAWEFIRWMEQPRNAGKFAAALHNVPAFKSLADDPEFTTDANFRVFMRLLGSANARHWPQIPVANMYATEIGSAEEAVVLGKKPAKEALDEVTRKIQAALDKAK
ncbi:MAG: ABC transporter substrate-binding protein [Firmicutes bacterium]|nr:ABC transporter substrate-binding protein [Bacillota bacterium]